MQKHIEITRQRLQVFANPDNLRGRIYPQRAPVQLAVYSAPDRISHAEALRGRYRSAKVGEQFGPLWSTHWFRVKIQVPRTWRGCEVHLLWDSSSEACVWRDGQPRQGLTGTQRWVQGAVRPQYRVARRARGGERIELHIEMACNDLFGVDAKAVPNTTGLLRQAEIAVFDREAWNLLWDFVVIADAAEHLPPQSPRAGQALHTANQMVNVCDLEDRATWPKARAVAARFLQARNGDGQHHLSAIGHAHIDTAWLWPLAETRRKCVRTFSSAIRYMEDYPEYQFACPQAQQLAWMKEFQPVLYAKIKRQVRAGRFHPVGGTWVEPDCNIPCGESLVRQFLFGQRFFQAEFGVTCGEFWNPDVFGYCAQLPQIMRGAEIDFFLTQKLSWNQFNKLPSHTFLWEGIDGSRVLTHFPPADTYNSTARVKEVVFNVKNFKDHERANESYLLFGHGDGGGGPTPEMLEQIRRMRDVDGLPRVEIRSAREFFRRCQADIRHPLVWVGELYFELHRGTYTTQARNKLNNRRSEILLRDVEFLCAVGHALKRLDYPSAELARLWKLVLLNQFHDIIPGSSINQVYADSHAQYREIFLHGANLQQKALSRLAGLAGNQHSRGDRLFLLNTLGAPRTEVVDLPFDAASSQRSASGRPLAVVSAPAVGYAVVEPETRVAEGVRVVQTKPAIVLENGSLRAVLRRDGHLTSLFDKRVGRESIAPGQAANHLVMFDDEPINWDAWDVDIYHLEKRFEVPGARQMRLVEKGPLRAAVEVRYDLSPRSRLKQTITLDAVSARLDFSNEVSWHERHKFLKVEFPLNVRAESATYEIQFGHIARPTHFNTSWDLARFEVCAQRWADLSEPDFGVALLNDCKFGYATHRNVMRLSLLRSPKMPDEMADMGHHAFRYALMPHPGSFREAGVIEEAARFNVALIAQRTRVGPTAASFFAVSHPGAVIDTIKKAEDSDALIVRLYEAHGTRRTIHLNSVLPVRRAFRCNLLERRDVRLKWTDRGVSLDLTPFQIVTVKLFPK